MKKNQCVRVRKITYEQKLKAVFEHKKVKLWSELIEELDTSQDDYRTKRIQVVQSQKVKTWKQLVEKLYIQFIEIAKK